METKHRRPSKRTIRPSTRILRRHLWLQIYLPLIIGSLVVIGMGLSFWLTDVGTASIWADVALVLVAIPIFILGILLFGLLAVFVYGVTRAYGLIPEPAGKVQDFMVKISTGTRRAGELLPKPIMMLKASITAIEKVIYLFTSILSKD